jgi:DNA-binding response OmpR family regulator
LFYSAAGYERDIEEALRSGAQAYLVKPVELEDLQETVKRLLSLIGIRTAEAWRAEIKAIREELAFQRVEHIELLAIAIERRQCAQEKLMRFKAERAFLAAWGTRGDFARRWPSVFIGEVRNHRLSG